MARCSCGPTPRPLRHHDFHHLALFYGLNAQGGGDEALQVFARRSRIFPMSLMPGLFS